MRPGHKSMEKIKNNKTKKKQEQKKVYSTVQKKMKLVSKMFIIWLPVYGEHKQVRDK